MQFSAAGTDCDTKKGNMRLSAVLATALCLILAGVSRAKKVWLKVDGREFTAHLRRNENLLLENDQDEEQECDYFVGQVFDGNSSGIAALDFCDSDGVSDISGYMSTSDGRSWELEGRGNRIRAKAVSPKKNMFHPAKEEGGVVREKRAFLDEDPFLGWDDGGGGYFIADEDEEENEAEEKSKRGEFVCNGPYCEYFKVGKNVFTLSFS